MSSSRAHCEPAGPDRTVAEVFDRFSEHFFSRYRHHLPKGAFKTLQDILLCRTEAMGGHRFRCDRCGHVHFAWHSCNNRLCPTCGAADNAAWTAAHLNRLLPVPYFLVTFTLPSELRQYAYSHPGAFYKLFFTATSRALKEILADPKRTGFFKSGFFAVLQSWKQDMLLHPHIHYVVPGIGLDGKGNLVTLKQPDFLVYAQVLANRLRTLMLQALQSEPRIDSALIAQLWRIDWVADVEPVGSGENAVKYLGQYVHKSVITDRRILAIDTHSVLIALKDRQNQCTRHIRLAGIEFIRRYLLHVLPPGFHRIRYYGLPPPPRQGHPSAAPNPPRRRPLHVPLKRFNAPSRFPYALPPLRLPHDPSRTALPLASPTTSARFPRAIGRMNSFTPSIPSGSSLHRVGHGASLFATRQHSPKRPFLHPFVLYFHRFHHRPHPFTPQKTSRKAPPSPFATAPRLTLG